jgi:hypothetical protein
LRVKDWEIMAEDLRKPDSALAGSLQLISVIGTQSCHLNRQTNNIGKLPLDTSNSECFAEAESRIAVLVTVATHEEPHELFAGRDPSCAFPLDAESRT